MYASQNKLKNEKKILLKFFDELDNEKEFFKAWVIRGDTYK